MTGPKAGKRYGATDHKAFRARQLFWTYCCSTTPLDTKVGNQSKSHLAEKFCGQPWQTELWSDFLPHASLSSMRLLSWEYCSKHIALMDGMRCPHSPGGFLIGECK